MAKEAKEAKKDEGGAKRRRPQKKGATLGGIIGSAAGGGVASGLTTMGVQALGVVDDRVVSGVNTAIGVGVAIFGAATKRPYVAAYGTAHALVSGAILANDAIWPAGGNDAAQIPDGGRQAGAPVLDQVRRELAGPPEAPEYHGGPVH